jgi:two-component system, NarL family, response regulator NreC
MDRIKLLLAYRDGLLRQALGTVLAAQPDVGLIVQAADGKQAVELAEQHHPDVVLMDAQMPVVSGIEATELIKQHAADVQVLLLTMGADEEMVLEMLRAGASGCILKDADLTDLVTAMRVTAKGGSYLSRQIEERLVNRYSRVSGRVGARPRNVLSLRERQVLQMVVDGIGNKAIAERLSLSVKTVEAHKANVAQKLGVRGSTELIKYAIRKGLIDLEPETFLPEREPATA